MSAALAYDPAALVLDAAAAEGACRLVAGARCHETIANPYPDKADPRNGAFLRAFRWQFRAEVSRETSHETILPREGPVGRGRGRFGPRREFTRYQTGLVVAAARLIPQAEIARAFGVSPASIRSRLCRARKGPAFANPPSRSPLRRAKEGASEGRP